MKKYIFAILISTVFFINNVNAKENKYNYSYNFSGETYDIYYDDINNQVCVSNTCVAIKKPYFYFYWQSYYLNITQYDNDDIIIHQENCPIPDSNNNTYFCSMNSNSNYDGFLTTSINIQTSEISVLENFADFHYGVKGWNQLVTNVNLYNTDRSIYFEKNLDVTINTSPTISITETSEEKTTVQDKEYLIAVNLNVESTNIDDSKYICMFSFDNKETWDKFNCSEKYSYKATNNGNYYAQIVSREDESVISSVTYTITKIQILPSSNPKIDIEITKKTNDQTDFISGGSCIINKNNNTYTQCEDINIKFSLIDESILKYEYSYDKQNWINFNFNILDKLDESNTISMRIYKNTTLYVRVINLDNNEINNSATYTITSINTTEFLTQEVTFQSVYYRDLMKIDVYSLFVNYDPTNYNYYFNTSADKNSFVDITNKIVCNSNTGCRYITSFDYSGFVYIRIEDKQGNYINTFTYTVNYDHYLEKKNVNDYMNDVPKFMESMKGYISKFTDVLNYFFTSLNSTIKYAIITLFIVLIATCLIRMGKK